MPHKEERFLFVVYPLIALSASVGMSMTLHILRGSGASKCRRTLARMVAVGAILAFVSLSVSRTTSLILNYGAPLKIWTELHQLGRAALKEPSVLPFPFEQIVQQPIEKSTIAHDASIQHRLEEELHQLTHTPHRHNINVCVGKEWYRYSSTFFLPTLYWPNGRRVDFRLRFLDSDFGGLLPKEFHEEWQYQARHGAHTFDELKAQQFARANVADGESITLQRQAHTSIEALFSHAITRPGTFVLPTGMNRDNRKEDDGRFVQVDTCEFIVDLELENQRETKYAHHRVEYPTPRTVNGACVSGYRWEVIASKPFLDATQSTSGIARAFFIPKWSNEKNVFKPYQLMQRVPIPCATSNTSKN